MAITTVKPTFDPMTAYDPRSSDWLPRYDVNSGYTNLFGALDNTFTGNTDWTRSQQLQANAFAFTAEQAKLARDFNAAEAQKLRDWQTEMSNSAYSRSIADLKKNGINPYMAINGLSAASTPSGAAGSSGIAHGDGGRLPGSANGWNNLINSAFNLASRVLSKKK